MRLRKLAALIAGTLMGAVSFTGCARKNNEREDKQQDNTEVSGVNKEYAERRFLDQSAKAEKAEVIYLAGGCFWGTQAYFDRLPGVTETEAGYANGKEAETSYREVDRTGHAETVKIHYDPEVISLAELLDRYYLTIDPLSLNKQGNDRGTQYRTGIYYEEEDRFSKEVAELSLALLNERLGKQSYIELLPIQNYVKAEDYHQDYLKKEPFGYCHIDLSLAERALFPLPEKSSREELAEKLDPGAFDDGTEKPFSSPLNEEFRPGVYLDAASGQVLFSSRDKFPSSSGWPSFSRGITTDALRMDFSKEKAGGAEAEVRTGNGQAHLGHIFRRTQGESTFRYCINGAGLRFVPEDEMRAEGLERFLPYLLKRGD